MEEIGIPLLVRNGIMVHVRVVAETYGLHLKVRHTAVHIQAAVACDAPVGILPALEGQLVQSLFLHLYVPGDGVPGLRPVFRTDGIVADIIRMIRLQKAVGIIFLNVDGRRALDDVQCDTLPALSLAHQSRPLIYLVPAAQRCNDLLISRRLLSRPEGKGCILQRLLHRLEADAVLPLLQPEDQRFVASPLVVLQKPCDLRINLIAFGTNLIVILCPDLLVGPISVDHHLRKRLVGDLIVYVYLSLYVRGGAGQREISQLQIVKSALSHLKIPCNRSVVFRNNALFPHISLQPGRCLVLLQIYFYHLVGQGSRISVFLQIRLITLFIGCHTRSGNRIVFRNSASADQFTDQQKNDDSRSCASRYFYYLASFARFHKPTSQKLPAGSRLLKQTLFSKGKKCRILPLPSRNFL